MSSAADTGSRRRVVVLGDGGWGTAIALTLVGAGHDVRLWSYDPRYAEELESSRRNRKYLPGVELPPSLTISSDAAALASDAELVFSVVPTQHLRATVRSLAGAIPAGLTWVSCSKGIETSSLELPGQILQQVAPAKHVCVLSGPSHAEEVSRELPTTVVVAAPDHAVAETVQALFEDTHLRVYTGTDPRGVELGGAVKNVIAIAAGISDGLGYGDNSRAAIVTRGLVEITRLGIAMGAQRETFSGLSGLGDLITTCTSEHSRNRSVGVRIGRGETLQEILATTETVAEGVETCRSLRALNRNLAVDMPISREVYAVLHENKPPMEAVASLMSRTTKSEMEDLV